MPKSESNRRYRITNWAEYNKSLIQRGSLTVWIDEDVAKKWYAPKQFGKDGRPMLYSDEAILIALSVRAVYNLPLRALEGFMRSVFLILSLALRVPSYSQICRRAKALGKQLNKLKLSTRRPSAIIFDSTGLKVFGEGEWKVRSHGVSKRRTWRKLHIAMDPVSGEITMADLTDNSAGDAQVAEEMLPAAHGNVKEVYGDGAYDSLTFREKIADKKAVPKIPPQRNAVRGKPVGAAIKSRNDAISEIAGLGGDDDARKLWKKLIGYHTRSLVETTMFRLKTIFSPTLRSRCLENQFTEAIVRCLTLNKMTNLGQPKGYWTSCFNHT